MIYTIGNRNAGIIVVGIYAPETKVSGIIIIELIVWNAGELRDTVARNRPTALKVIAEINITASIKIPCKTSILSPITTPIIAVTVQNETLVRIASTQTVTAGGRTMTNHNKLLRYVDGCIGLKTGYTRAAGRTLVSCAERNGQRLVAVTLQDGNDWADHQALFDYGFSAYPARRAAVLGHSVGTAEVRGGVSNTVPLTAASGFSWPVGAGERLETRVELDRPLAAPVLAGTAVGQAVFTLDGAEVGRVDLLCGRTVPPELKTAMGALKTGLSE